MRAEDVIVVGALRTVAYARDASGRAHARDFFEGECPATDRVRLDRWFGKIAEHGERVARDGSFKHEAGPIHAFKSGQERIATFRVGNTWFLTHGFIKKRDTWPRTQLARAERIRLESIAREGSR
jgi:hypothetical protein